MDKAVKLNVRATKLKSHMQLEFKKPGLSTRHIRYIMQKVKVKDTDNEDLEVFLAAIEDEGGSVEVLLDQDNNDAPKDQVHEAGKEGILLHLPTQVWRRADMPIHQLGGGGEVHQQLVRGGLCLTQ